MKNVFKKMTIQHIQIEERTNLAEVEVQTIQGKILIETVLVLGPTDLNQLLAKLNAKGIALSLTEDFEYYPTDEGLIYTLNFEKKGLDHIEIEEFTPLHRVKQIRA
ncbi:hypothetical protein [Brumimicrobium aurantiacum]|uniref:Uncharacterized protein n=1 Tax=Brumimicrobium aurantiacum TaxID=1737063 RepID=A0A3E1EXT5_9FLAO|nr:hypothetical protein [Brumimicrobium aurantiacum]RFC54362.1 hypothetical protein DXU93_08010 [Brumimicrobium aurantiacum]